MQRGIRRKNTLSAYERKTKKYESIKTIIIQYKQYSKSTIRLITTNAR